MPAAEIAPRSTTGSQRSTIVGALWVLTCAIVIAFVVSPQIGRWRTREARLSVARLKLQDLTNVVRNRPTIDASVQQHELELSLRPQRILRSRSRALASSALQSLIQEMAESSNVTVTRLDAANLATNGDLPITLSANGDIYGLVELLRQIRSAPYAVSVDKLQAQNNSALRGAPDVLQMTLSLRAPVIIVER